MPHSYWLRPRRQRIDYSENRPYGNLRSIPSSKEGFMAQRMASAAVKLELTGEYLMDNAARLNRIDYYDARADNESASTSIESNQSITATIIAFIYRFIVAIVKGAKCFCTQTVTMVMKIVQRIIQATAHNVTSIVTLRLLTHRLSIFILLLLSGCWIISPLSNMSQFPRKSESLNTNFVSILNRQNSISCENKYEVTIKKRLQNSFAGFSDIRSDDKEEISADLAKFVRSLIEEAVMSKEKETKNFLRSLIDEALMKFNADKTGMADFALESGGGSVISTRCSETFTKNSVRISIFGLPLYYKYNPPKTAIQPGVNAGECWPFKGSTGTLVIKLSHKIKITAFSMEHIPKSLSHLGHIKSAPKDFSSLSDPDDYKGVYLGSYTYKDDGKPIQQFITQVNNANPTQYVELRISSNHGNLEYTCLYRFRVHGVFLQSLKI